MGKRDWTPEEVAGEAQRSKDTELYAEAFAAGEAAARADERRKALLEAAEVAEEEAELCRPSPGKAKRFGCCFGTARAIAARLRARSED